MNSSSNEPSRAADLLRQGVVAGLAVTQIVASALLGRSTGAIARQDPSSILPAGYTFTIWGLIFIAVLGYAVTALVVPSVTSHPAVRASGWPVAVALAANTAWPVLFGQRLFPIAQVVIVIGAGAAVWATVALQRTAGDRTLVRVLGAGTVGLLAGWLTAAAVVGLANTVTAGPAMGATLLAVLALAVVLVLRAGAGGPALGSIAYAAAAGWALVGVAVEQWTASPLTALTALGVLAVVAVALVTMLIRDGRRPDRPRPAPAARAQRPGVA